MARPSKLSEEVLQKIRHLIQNNLKVGDKLPSESVLCEYLGVSRTTVRECIAILTSQGLLINQKGVKYVSDSPQSYCNSVFHTMLNMDICSISDMLQVRNLLEIDIVRIVAANPTEETLKDLEHIVWELQRPDISDDEFAETDIRFHNVIAQATNNKLLVDLLSSIRQICTNGFQTSPAYPCQDKQRLIDNRIQMVQALKNRNLNRAVNLAQKHIEETRVFFGLQQLFPILDGEAEEASLPTPLSHAPDPV